MPRRFYVIDSPTYDAAALGTTLFVHRELIYTPYLEAVLAHECGHLEGADSQLLLALQRFAVPGLHRIHDALHRMGLPAYAGVVLMIAGGWGQMVTGFAWRWYFRRREFYADRRAAKRGYRDRLIEYLQTHSLPLDIAAPFMRGRSHPYAEERIARLRSTG